MVNRRSHIVLVLTDPFWTTGIIFLAMFILLQGREEQAPREAAPRNAIIEPIPHGPILPVPESALPGEGRS